MPRTSYPLILTFALLVSPGLARPRQSTETQLAPGVRLQQETIQSPAGPAVANVLRVDLKRSSVHVKTALAQDVVLADDVTQGRETIGSLVQRKHAVAGVNADYFPYTGDPLGLAIMDGDLVSESMPYRVAMGITSQGAVLFDTLLTVGTLTLPDGLALTLDGIDRPVGKDELVLLTPAFGARSRAGLTATVVPLKELSGPIRVGHDVSATAAFPMPGDQDAPVPQGTGLLAASGTAGDWLRLHVRSGSVVRIRFDLTASQLAKGVARGALASRAGSRSSRHGSGAWMSVNQAVSGGPWLVRDGAVALDGLEEGFDETSFVLARHPRTAVGVTASGELLLVTVDGRQAHSKGLSLPELAAYMLRLGAVRAINLDGGGSTTMAARDVYVNSPSDGVPNAVADALLVFSDEEPETPPVLEAATQTVTLRVGETVALPPPAVAEGAGTPTLWGTAEGKAYVSQQGMLTGTRAGTGFAVARRGASEFRYPYVVLGGVASAIKGFILPADNNPPDRNVLNVRVSDAKGNPVVGASVRIQVSGGSAEQATAVTDVRGAVSTEIVWDSETMRSVTVSVTGVTPLTIKVR